jgi:hypothetical protein
MGEESVATIFTVFRGALKMYNDRIIEGSIDFSQYHEALFCPNCGERIATRYVTKTDKKEAYRFVPSVFNKKKKSPRAT